MQMDEEIELAFKAGVEWTMENVYCNIVLPRPTDDCISLDRNIEDGIQEYINGNLKPNKS